MAQLIPDGTYIITSASNGKLVELQNASPTGNFIMVSKPEEQTLPSKQKVCCVEFMCRAVHDLFCRLSFSLLRGFTI